jgi:hypothetical protein
VRRSRFGSGSWNAQSSAAVSACPSTSEAAAETGRTLASVEGSGDEDEQKQEQ